MPLCSVLLFLSIQFFCCRKISFSADSIKLLPIYINNLLPLYLYLFKATTKEKKRLRDRPLFRERDGNEENAKVFKPTTVEKRPSTDKEMIFLFLFFFFQIEFLTNNGEDEIQKNSFYGIYRKLIQISISTIKTKNPSLVLLQSV